MGLSAHLSERSSFSGEKVDNWMGPSEVLVAQCLCGVVWGLLSCQPVVIVSQSSFSLEPYLTSAHFQVAATGPVLVFEESLYLVSTTPFLIFHSSLAFCFSFARHTASNSWSYGSGPASGSSSWPC